MWKEIFFNNEINAKIAQSNVGKSQQKQEKFVSEEKDLKAIANSKIKNPFIVQHTPVVTSEDEMKRKSPANSKDLGKQGQRIKMLTVRVSSMNNS